MRLILTDILHIFILALMGGFVILLFSSTINNSKVWTKRYIRGRRGKITPNQFE